VKKVSYRPIVLECLGCGAALALPDADVFECDYCGMHMVYILGPFGNQVYAYNPGGSFDFSFSEEGDRTGRYSLSTGLMAITEQHKLIISDIYCVDLFDGNGNYLNQTVTIDYNVAARTMCAMTIDS